MSEQERLTRARVIDGELYVDTGDGVWRKSASQTDWAKVDATTEDEIIRQAREDGTLDIDLENARLVVSSPKAALKRAG